MKTRLLVAAVLAATTICWTVPLRAESRPLTALAGAAFQVLQESNDAISSIPPPKAEAAAPSAEKPAAPEVGQGGLTLGWRQLRELFLGFSGVPMWALVVCSILVVTFVLERLTALQVRRVMPRAFVSRFLQRLRDENLDRAKIQELSEICRENGSPIAHFFAVVVENAGRPGVEIRVNVSDAADSELFHLRKHVRGLSGLAMLAPLLGLFGTVLGMISAFHALSQQTGSGKTELLASGISLALIATASGLAVAIVASVAYYFLLGRVDRLIQEMDLLTTQAISLVASDGRPREAEKKIRRAPVMSAEQKSA